MPDRLSLRSLGRLAVVAGVLLLLVPLGIQALPAGEYTHHYAVSYVETTENGSFTVSGYLLDGFDDDVLCFASYSRACALEKTLLNRSVVAEVGVHGFDRLTDYQYVYDDWTFYEVESTDRTLWLRAVENSTALAGTAEPPRSVPEGVLASLRDGETEVATAADVPANGLVAVEDGRYARLRQDYRSLQPYDRYVDEVKTVLSPVSFLSGLALVLLGQRWRTTSRFRR